MKTTNNPCDSSPSSYLAKWNSLQNDLSKIPGIFKYAPDSRIIAYKLDYPDLYTLINPPGVPPNQLRFTIGVNPNYSSTNPVPTAPAFNLFVQSYFADAQQPPPAPDYIGSFAPLMNYTTIIDPETEIPQGQALAFVMNWKSLEVEDIADSLFSSEGQVKTYVFGALDVSVIRAYLIQHEPQNPSIYAFLGWNVVTLPDPPPNPPAPVNPNFAIVLRVGDHIDHDLNAYFEFAQPCPPGCNKVVTG